MREPRPLQAFDRLHDRVADNPVLSDFATVLYTVDRADRQDYRVIEGSGYRQMFWVAGNPPRGAYEQLNATLSPEGGLTIHLSDYHSEEWIASMRENGEEGENLPYNSTFIVDENGYALTEVNKVSTRIVERFTGEEAIDRITQRLHHAMGFFSLYTEHHLLQEVAAQKASREANAASAE